MVYTMELFYNEIILKCVTKYCDAKTTEYNLPPGVNDMSDLNAIILSQFHSEVKVTHKMIDIKLRSPLTTEKTKKFSKKSLFFKTIYWSSRCKNSD